VLDRTEPDQALELEPEEPTDQACKIVRKGREEWTSTPLPVVKCPLDKSRARRRRCAPSRAQKTRLHETMGPAPSKIRHI